MILRTRFLFATIHGLLIVLLVSACTAPPVAEPEPLAQATSEVIIQGDTPGREEVQTIELDNCGGKADAARSEERTQSIEVTISTEVAAKIGASAQVVSAEVQTAVGLAITPGSQRGMSIELVAPPDTRMVFELVWIGKEQIGVVQNIRNSDIPVAFRSFSPTDVRIKSQSDIGCSRSNLPQTVFDPTTTVTETCPQDILTYPGNFLSEEKIPPDPHTSMEITVNNGEIHAMTAGKICASGVCLPGGTDRGSVVILLPSATYEITGLNPIWNWHGGFRLERNEWKPLADVLVANMKNPGTCSDGDGCSIVDVLIVEPNGVISQYVDQGPVNCSGLR